jgi:hypothetical protein
MRERIRSLMRNENKRTSVVTTATPLQPALRTQWLERLVSRRPPVGEPE